MRRKSIQAIVQKNTEQVVMAIKEVMPAPPTDGWLRTIRNVLAMPARWCAAKMHITPQAVLALEQSEMKGTISLNTLRKAANSMDCELVYAIVPKSSLQAIIQERAQKKEASLQERVHHSMLIEDQAVSGSLEAEIPLPNKQLWND